VRIHPTLKRSRNCVVALSGLCVHVLSCPAASAEPRAFQGPADLRNQRPYQLLFLAFSPERTEALGPGHSALSAQLDIGNNLLVSTRNNVSVREDTETERLALKYRWGLGHGFEAAVAAPLMWRNAGFTDKIIENYHHLINVTGSNPDIDGGRREVSAYHSMLSVTDSQGHRLVDAGPAAGIGDLQITLKRDLVKLPWHALSARVGVKLPTGTAGNLIGSGGTDFGVDLTGSVALTDRLCLYGDISEVAAQRDSHVALKTNQRIRRGILALEYYTNSRTSWIVQNEIADAALRTGNPFVDGNQGTFALAVKYKPNARTTWTYGFTENGGLFAYQANWAADIAPDPTFTIGWETTR